MPELSFPLFARGVLPRGNPCKQAVLFLTLLFAVGCGGGGSVSEQLLRGAGYTFSAPAGWQTSRGGREVRASLGIALVSVTRYELLNRFRPERWAKVVPELDRAAAEVAKQQAGTVSDSETMTVADRDARRYDIDYERDGKQLVERIAFVLREKTEYLLLCRYERGGDTRACERLLATFRLT
jgi:hypothetical protein